MPYTLRNLLVARWAPQPLALEGDTALVYVLRAFGREGSIDETAPRRIQLVDAREFASLSAFVGQSAAPPVTVMDEPSGAPGSATGEALTPMQGRFLLLRPGSADLATPPTVPRKAVLGDLAGLDDETLGQLYGRSDLVRRSIAVHGSRVRVAGREIDDTMAVRINGQVVPVDSDGDLAYETILPVGRHQLFLDLVPVAGDVWPMELSVDVTGRHWFMVGLADLTLQRNSLAGSVEPLAADDRYLESTVSEGRLAMYLKGKIRGKYLLTAQLDTQEEQLDELLDQIDEKDPRRLFRSIDPDRYYPVYGDDSTTLADTNSQGRFYARVEWDRSRAVLGNFNTNFTGTEFAQYNRTLYGASLAWRGLKATGEGEPVDAVDAFVSDAQTALGHDEFIGTGGSLYYLRRTDVVEGSAKVRVEIVDPVTERTLENLALVEGVDYELDELQGRLLLSKPLSQVTRHRAPYLVRDAGLDGPRTLLVVDYEYVPVGFDSGSTGYGFRGRKWLGDRLAVGGTWVDESRDAQDYQLAGADVTFKAGRGTYVKLEYAQTEATQAVRYFSADGGLSFAALNPLGTAAAADDREGEAYGLEGRVNLREQGWTRRDATVAAWWSRKDEQFAVARRDEGFGLERMGLEAQADLPRGFRTAFRASTVDRSGLRPGLASQVDQVAAQVTWRRDERDSASAELQYVNARLRPGETDKALLAALEYRRSLNDAWDAYFIVQAQVDGSNGEVGRDIATLGTRYAIDDAWAVDAELSMGDGADGLSATLEYRRSDRHTLYGTFSHSVDRSDELLSSVSTLSGMPGNESRSGFYENPGNNLALGSRWQVSDQTRVFNEAQFIESAGRAGLAHVFGLDFGGRRGWRYGLSLQKGDFAGPEGFGNRSAISGSVGFAADALNWSSRLEYRKDSGALEATQYLTSNRVEWKLRDSFRVLGKLNYSQTEQDAARLNAGNLIFGQAATDARFAEASVGLAYRPTSHDRFNWLAKLTWLYDLGSFGQVGDDASAPGVANLLQSQRTDQKSLVASLEGVYRLTPKFDLGAKLARRGGQVRLGRAEDAWIDSTATFYAARLSYELISKWDAMVEYRVLDVPESSSRRKGLLVGIDREIRRNFRLGVGYNFTDFSDNLTYLSYEFEGFFVNVVGKY
jgi:hypothetical protein